MNVSITRCAPAGFAAHSRSVVRAALAATILAIPSIGLTTQTTARAETVARARTVAAVTVMRHRYLSRSRRLDVFHWARRQQGKPYIWGGTGPYGFDCSGLVFAAYRSQGIPLPRTTYGMLGSWRLVRVSHRAAKKGDLAFFGPGHVELFVGGRWTYGAAESGTRIGFHLMNAWWHPTMYFRVRL